MTTATTLAPLPRDASPLDVLERVITTGDLAAMSPADRVALYARTCESLGLNPLTRPFEYISLNGKLTLYVRKDATDQLRRINRVSIDVLVTDDSIEGLHRVVASGHTPDGRADQSTGAVWIKGLSGDALANAVMKAETKAKRRLTLSLVGLGFLDESEIETVGGQPVEVDPETGEIRAPAPAAPTLLEQVEAQRARLATPSAPITTAVEEPVETETGVCGVVDTSPLEVGTCDQPKGHAGPHRNAAGTFPS